MATRRDRKTIALGLSLVAIERVTIRRGTLGFVVDTQPRVAQLRKRFAGRGNGSFSRAVGYASGFAAWRGCEFVDETARLTRNDCAALVAAQSATEKVPF